MSYVRSNTSNPLGRRTLGWDNSPYPVYRQPELSRTRGLVGEWIPAPPPARATQHQGAVTYRIDPSTGRYRFYNTDILPRGVWQQNTFQHPPAPTLSALGVPVTSRGKQLVEIAGRQHVIANSPRKRLRKKKGLGCCGLGASTDTMVDPATGCISDTDGNLLSCPGGVDPYFDIGNKVAAITSPGPLPQAPTVQQLPAGAGNIVGNVAQQVISALGQRPVVTLPQSRPSWLTPTNIAIAVGAGALLLLGSGRKR